MFFPYPFIRLFVLINFCSCSYEVTFQLLIFIIKWKISDLYAKLSKMRMWRDEGVFFFASKKYLLDFTV